MVRSRVLCLVLLIWTVGTVEEQAPQFKADVRLIEVDVRVTDARGRFVHGLRPEDFEIKERGVLQWIAAFIAIDPFATSTVRPVDSNPFTPAAQIWIFVFDDRNMQASGFRRAHAAVEGFVTRDLRQGDFVGIVYGDRMVDNRISSSASDILRAVKRVSVPGELADGFMPPELIERRTRNSLDVIEVLTKELATFHGPMTLALFSDGLPLEGFEGTLRTVVKRTIEAGARYLLRRYSRTGWCSSAYPQQLDRRHRWGGNLQYQQPPTCLVGD